MRKNWLIAGMISLILASCGGDAKEQDENDGYLTILATTGMIEDAVQNIVGDSAHVLALMGPGVDPHLYKATQGDLKKMQDADVVFYNGLHLEGKLSEVLKKLSRLKPVYAVADGVPEEKLRRDAQFQNAIDPHIWFDVSLWKYAVSHIQEKLAEKDPARADFYLQNTRAYLQKLDSLHEAVKVEINKIPQEKRVLITAHDAFGYFGDAYHIEVRGLQGISTMSEYGLRDITELVDYIVSRNINAIFIETSVSDRSIKSVVEGCNKRGHTVEIGGNLYSDAMGPKGAFAGTYIGMVSHNVKTITEALNKK